MVYSPCIHGGLSMHMGRPVSLSLPFSFLFFSFFLKKKKFFFLSPSLLSLIRSLIYPLVDSSIFIIFLYAPIYSSSML